MQLRESKSLKVGDVFDVDLFDMSGRLVLPARQSITEAILAEFSQRGIVRLVTLDAVEHGQPQKVRVDYDVACLKQARQMLDDGPHAIAEHWKSLADGQRLHASHLNTATDAIYEAVSSDTAALLSTVLNVESNGLNSPAARSYRTAAIGMTVAKAMGRTEQECRSVCRAAMLHEVGLPNGVPDFATIPPDSIEYDQAVKEYLYHPLKASDLVRENVMNVDPIDIVLIAQVHEQCDGSGFPRGLSRIRLHPLSSILNVVDAFVTLTTPNDPLGGYVPADVLAYLAEHALFGTFDLPAVQALIASTAVYPVGSSVVLEDDSKGVVLRSTGRDYTRPIIQRVDIPAEQIDLRQSDNQIKQPAQGTHFKRITKSLMEETLWVANY